MFKDDRMISFLTAIIVMVAIGTIVQRADIFSGEGDGKVIVSLVDDDLVLPANALHKLDIFANDTGISNAEKESLVVLSEPKCGRILARRGVLQYYASDECAGEQQIVYTLEAMAEPQTATVRAFVVSDQHPDIRPGGGPKVASGEATSSGDSPKATPFRADDEVADDDVADDDVADDDVADDEPAPDGDAAPVLATGAPGDDDNAKTGTADDGALAVAEADARRSLPGNAPDSPSSGDVSGGALVRDDRRPDAATRADAPDRPDMPTEIDDGDGGTLTLALVRPDAEPRGSETKGAAALIPPDRAPDTPPEAGEGRNRGSAGDAPDDMTPDTAGTGRAAAGDGPPTSDNAPPPNRAADSAGLSEAGVLRDASDGGENASFDRSENGSDVIADRNIAALTPSDTGVGSARVDARVPPGTDVTPKPLRADTVGNSERWERLTTPPAGLSRDAPGARMPDPDLPGGSGTWLGPNAVAAADAADLVEGNATGRVPLPIARSVDVANLDGDAASRDRPALDIGTSTDPSGSSDGVMAERKVAALDPASKAVSAAIVDARVPLGTDVTPNALKAEGAGDADAWKRMVPTSAGPDPDGPAMREAGPADALTGGAGPGSGGLPGAGAVRPTLPRADLGAAKRLAAISPRLEDDRQSIRHDRPERPTPHAENVRQKLARRTAALSPDQSGTPRPDLMNRSLEPDPVAAKPAPGILAPRSGSDAPPGDAPATDRRIAALPPPAGSVPGAVPGAALARLPINLDDGPPARTGDGDGGEIIAALPGAAAECTVPPSTELEIRRAAQTVIRINAPCQADSVAELSYSGLRLAIPLDREGRGSIVALGFEASAPAIVRFSDDAVLDFDIPFPDVNRVERVAVVWDLPVALELHALEFGAQTGDPNHVYPGNRRTFGDVRRRGGGFLHGYRAYAGVGQNAQIYTHWKRGGAPSGIIKLMVDFASRNRDRLEGTCGDGIYAAPGFVVLRASAGRIERPVTRRLAALPCSRILEEVGDKRLISGAIDDLVITN